MKRAVLYMRTSIREVENRTDSLAYQKEQLEQFCSANGIAIIGEYSDFNLTEEKRINHEGLNNALRLFFDGAFAKKPIDYLVTTAPRIFGETELVLLRGELGFYSSELITIKEK